MKLKIPKTIEPGLKNDARLHGRTLHQHVIALLKESLGFDPDRPLNKQLWDSK